MQKFLLFMSVGVLVTSFAFVASKQAKAYTLCSFECGDYDYDNTYWYNDYSGAGQWCDCYYPYQAYSTYMAPVPYYGGYTGAYYQSPQTSITPIYSGLGAYVPYGYNSMMPGPYGMPMFATPWYTTGYAPQ